MVKLSPAQIRALATLEAGVEVMMTPGGVPIGHMPDGVRSQRTFWRLRVLGFVAIKPRPSADYWEITEAGRNALQAVEK
ncbi:hypothetical protein FZC33_05805 [Labrys sp. KNU-23]|uniref:hypothetical protein n=1 Tax=Labrys sp. KNU-23 TaxID=2789216 RepID=UPI0011EFC52A|nr:hypothetical protein [Labrys sp. KNU-23]QEN85747.1 hypothetical protein FZC33_05805 [Labrys sp. KNU-23]